VFRPMASRWLDIQAVGKMRINVGFWSSSSLV
jgi:hypothetical protein